MYWSRAKHYLISLSFFQLWLFLFGEFFCDWYDHASLKKINFIYCWRFPNTLSVNSEGCSGLCSIYSLKKKTVLWFLIGNFLYIKTIKFRTYTTNNYYYFKILVELICVLKMRRAHLIFFPITGDKLTIDHAILEKYIISKFYWRKDEGSSTSSYNLSQNLNFFFLLSWLKFQTTTNYGQCRFTK